MTLRRIEVFRDDNWHGPFTGMSVVYPDGVYSALSDIIRKLPAWWNNANLTTSEDRVFWFTEEGWNEFGEPITRVLTGVVNYRILTSYEEASMQPLDEWQAIAYAKAA